MKKLLWLTLPLLAQSPQIATEDFRMGRYEEAYPQFRRLFDKSRDYLWGTYAVECLLQQQKTVEYQKWLQSERYKGRLSIWGLAWEARRRYLEGDTNATQDWESIVGRRDVDIPTLEALAEIAFRVWGLLEWQRKALYAARRLNPSSAAYADVLISSYERENLFSAAWREWLNLWKARSIPTDTLSSILQGYLGNGLSADSAEGALLEIWQQNAHPTIATLLLRLYLMTEQYSEALRYARSCFRMERDCRPLYEVGWTAYERGLFTTASEAFRLIISAGEVCPYYATAVSRYTEAEALQRQPQRALAVIDSLLQRFPANAALLLEKARWHLRLAQPDSVISLMKNFDPPLISTLAQKYLLLAEAALHKGDFVQSRLYLLEIESRLPQSTWQSEVYFQLARLAYFQGEFDLAKTRLRLLKHNTQDDLSNDAIQLFWHIEDNLKPDTLITPLKLYARAEVLKLQNRHNEALRLLDSIQQTYKGHPITDDILWSKAQYFLNQRDTAQAKTYLALLADYPDTESLYRDDALYLLGEISSNPKEALRYYERLLREVPGSLYARLTQEKLQKWAR
ncbi:MAG: hypothetical protein NZZ60_09000 [Bacteroidia bacterium]|nr:hypothetical protein [Bacteroidia bacterium]MCX7651983.1 hypothetical protein [Bacteroidia bacterium]MDW8417582.1 hypothetical protein [Bacteroidia bacterium]